MLHLGILEPIHSHGKSRSNRGNSVFYVAWDQKTTARQSCNIS